MKGKKDLSKASKPPIRPIESPLPAALSAIDQGKKEESPERTVEEGNCSGERREAADSSVSDTSSVIRIVSDPNEEPGEEQESREMQAEGLGSADRQDSRQALKLEVESQIRLIKQTIQQTVRST